MSSFCDQADHAKAAAQAARQELRRSHSAIKPLLVSLGVLISPSCFASFTVLNLLYRACSQRQRLL